MIRRILVGLAATSLVASPVMAQSAASALSLSAQSTASAGEEGSGGASILAPALAGVIVVMGVLLATDTWPFDNDDEEPVSP